MNGGPGSTSGAFLRGANRGQTLVLIDGLRVGSSSVGATSLEAIPLDQIERVEILRGPASSLYGADAIGGVIQVFTKRAQGDAFAGSASAGYGTYDTRNASATAARRDGAARVLGARAAARAAPGFNAIVNPANFSYNPERDGYSTRTWAETLSLPWASGQDVSVQYFQQPAQQSVRCGRSVLRRPHDHDAGSVVGREPQPPRRATGTRSSRRRGQRRLGFAHVVRRVAVQDDAAPVHVAERLDAAARTAVGRARAARGAPGDQRGLRGDAAEHQLGHRRVPARATMPLRCRPICATTTRANTAARRRAASRAATRYRRNGG